MAVNDLSATLVDNARFEPEQVLVLAFNMALRDRDVNAGTRAWLLPEKNAKLKDDEQTLPYGWSEGEIDEALLKQSTPIELKPDPAEREWLEVHSFKYHAAVGCRLYVRVDKGLKSFGGFILGNPHAQVIEVQRRMDTIFRRVFSDWVVNSFVLPNNYDQVTFEDFRRNVNVFDKLISNQRLSESAKTKVITKLKNVRGPSHNILTSPKLAILHDYMVAFMDMDGVVHTEMIIDRIRRP